MPSHTITVKMHFSPFHRRQQPQDREKTPSPMRKLKRWSLSHRLKFAGRVRAKKAKESTAATITNDPGVATVTTTITRSSTETPHLIDEEVKLRRDSVLLPQVASPRVTAIESAVSSGSRIGGEKEDQDKEEKELVLLVKDKEEKREIVESSVAKESTFHRTRDEDCSRSSEKSPVVSDSASAAPVLVIVPDTDSASSLSSSGPSEGSSPSNPTHTLPLNSSTSDVAVENPPLAGCSPSSSNSVYITAPNSVLLSSCLGSEPLQSQSQSHSQPQSHSQHPLQSSTLSESAPSSTPSLLLSNHTTAPSAPPDPLVMAEQDIRSQIHDIHKALQTQDYNAAPPILSRAKHSLLKLNALIPSPSTPTSHLALARETLELGALLSIRLEDTGAFTRYVTQLQPFYEIPASRLSREDSQRNKIMGLYLLLLLSKGEYAAFHTLLEGLQSKASSGKGGEDDVKMDGSDAGGWDGQALEDNDFIQYPIRLEQALMEGSYNKVWSETEAEKVPSVEFAIFSKV